MLVATTTFTSFMIVSDNCTFRLKIHNMVRRMTEFFNSKRKIFNVMTKHSIDKPGFGV